MNKKLKAVVFDIDGTLTNSISWLDMTRGLGASTDEHLSIFEDYIDGRISYPESKRLLLGLWAKTGNNSRQFILDMYGAWQFKHNAKTVIETIKGRGLRVCLITGSMDIFAESVSRYLGVEHYYANTDTTFDENGYLVDYSYVKDQGAKKLLQFQDFCASQSLESTDVMAVGNGKNDVKLFVATGRGVLVADSGNKDLVEKARWVIDDLAELVGIIDGAYEK